jgi:hypothetical protein
MASASAEGADHRAGEDVGTTRKSSLLERLHRGDFGAIVLVFLLSRAAWLILLFAGGWQFPRSFCQWDCGWYLNIVENGYMTSPYPFNGQANWAFFPLYPLLVRGLAATTGLSPIMAGIVLSNAAILAAVAVGCRYLRLTRPNQSVAYFIVLVLAGPYGFYFGSPYTEGLSYLLTCAAFLWWVEERPVRAGLAGFLLSMARPQGVFMVVALAADFLKRHGTKAPRVALKRPGILVTGIVAPAGLFAYMAYLYKHVGDAFAFSHIEAAWGRHFGNPVLNLLRGLGHSDIGNLLHGGISNFYNAWWAVAGFVLLGWLARRGLLMEAAFGLVYLLLPLSTGLDSIPRFVAGCPVFVFAAADALTRMQLRRTTVLLLLGLMIAADLIVLAAWFNGANFLI